MDEVLSLDEMQPSVLMCTSYLRVPEAAQVMYHVLMR